MHLGQIDSGRNARQQFSPQDRARVCRAIHRYLEIESTRAATHKRNVRLRLLIGLPPVPRPITEGVAA
jgi:hypothetical protein